MVFALNNCYIVGERGNFLNFTLAPRSTRLIHIVPLSPGSGFIAELLKDDYTIELR
jgi:hypothetical protein